MKIQRLVSQGRSLAAAAKTYESLPQQSQKEWQDKRRSYEYAAWGFVMDSFQCDDLEKLKKQLTPLFIRQNRSSLNSELIEILEGVHTIDAYAPSSR